MPKTKTTSKAQCGRMTLGSPVQVIGKKRKSAAKAKPGHGKRRTPKQTHIESRPLLEPHAAGIDMGAREMYVAVPPDRDAHPVRVFHTFTADLNELADWLVACGVTTVAMESTGVYWIPWDYCVRRSGRRRQCVRYGQSCGSAENWCRWPAHTSSICTRRSLK